MTTEIPAPATTATPEPGHVPGAYSPVPRPGLSPREKTGAFWAGAVGFNLLTLGFSLVLLPLAAALFWSIFVFFITNVSKSLNGSGLGPSLQDFGFDLSPWIVPGIAVAVIGVALMAVAIIASRAILKGHGVHRPSGVTWAGAGIAIVGFWLLCWIPALIAQLTSSAMSSADAGWDANLGFSGAALALSAVVINTVVGWLAWWWMAHALRRTSAGALATATQGQE